MGTLGGHLVPGIAFFTMAVWWSFVTTLRYIMSKKYAKIEYKSTVTMPMVISPWAILRKAPTESFIRIIVLIIAFAAEAQTGFYYKTKIIVDQQPSLAAAFNSTVMHTQWAIDNRNIQHMTMYSVFLLGSLLECLMHYGWLDLPERLDAAWLSVSFISEAFLFAFHLHGKTELEVYVHVLLIYAILACALFAILELYDNKQVLFTYGRVAFTLLQATWFCQIGFVLFPPSTRDKFKWDMNDHESILITTVCYVWHFLLITIGLIIQLWILNGILRNSSDSFLKNLADIIYYPSKSNTNRKGRLTLTSSSRIQMFEEMNSNDEEEQFLLNRN